jgi:hypothetical protein
MKERRVSDGDSFFIHRVRVISARVFHRDGKYGEFVVVTRAREGKVAHSLRRIPPHPTHPRLPPHSRLWSLRQFSPTSVHVMRSYVDGHLLPRLNNPVKATFSCHTREQRIIESAPWRKTLCNASRDIAFECKRKRKRGLISGILYWTFVEREYLRIRKADA